MSKCDYLIDISPYDPLCDHPCKMYGGGAVDAECETCQYRIEDLELKNEKLQAENAKLRKIAADIHKALFSLDIDHCQACPRDTINGPCTKYSVFGDDECSIEKDMRELGVERDA